MKFAIVCILFVLAALTYFRLNHWINIDSDIISEDKKAKMRNIKLMLQAVMVGLGVLVILCGYDLLYIPGADKYLGSKCGCSGGTKMKVIRSDFDAPMPQMSMSPMFSGVHSLPDF